MKRFLLTLLLVVFAVSTVLFGTGCNGGGAAQTIEVPTGWKQFSSADFELYLPEQWEGGSEEELQNIIDILRQEGQIELASQVEAGIPYMLFWGYDSDTAVLSDTLTNVNIGSESASFTSLEKYMEIGYDQMADTYAQMGYVFTILEQDITSIGYHKEVGRTLVSEEAAGFEVRMAQYIVKSGNDFWIITFTTSPEEFNQYIANFDKAVETFILK